MDPTQPDAIDDPATPNRTLGLGVAIALVLAVIAVGAVVSRIDFSGAHAYDPKQAREIDSGSVGDVRWMVSLGQERTGPYLELRTSSGVRIRAASADERDGAAVFSIATAEIVEHARMLYGTVDGDVDRLLVQLADGSERTIEPVRVGDIGFVYAVFAHTDSVAAFIAVNVWNEEMQRLTCSGEGTFGTTGCSMQRAVTSR